MWNGKSNERNKNMRTRFEISKIRIKINKGAEAEPEQLKECNNANFPKTKHYIT